MAKKSEVIDQQTEHGTGNPSEAAQHLLAVQQESDENFGSLVPINSPMATMLNEGMYKQLKKVAGSFSESQLIPAHFRGKPHDVFIALHMAHRLGCDPILVLQNLYIVSGNPGWRSQFIIAQANLSGIFKGRITFATDNTNPSNLSVTAKAIMKDTGEEVSATVDMAMARAEGWTNNKKYNSMPEHMLCFRSATFLVRRYAPEVMLGVPVVDEIEDMGAAAGIGADLVHEERPLQSAAQISDKLLNRKKAVDKEPAQQTEDFTDSELEESRRLDAEIAAKESGKDYAAASQGE